MNLFTKTFCTIALMGSSAMAGGHANWTSVADESSVAFGSVKKDTVGEVHHFDGVMGTVSEAGDVSVSIDLASVETNIDIRNERMLEHVFKAAMPNAVLQGQVDMDEVTSLAVGETAIVDFEGSLSLASVSADVEAEMLVARLADDRVLVTTADFIMLSTGDLGVDAGVDKLQELAKLPGITRVAPVSIRMIFELKSGY